MASLKLNHIYKVYENGTKAVSDFNIDIKDKEFIVFVGPSGCGKSTTLRMIAGLEDITAGDLFIDEKLVNNLEPKDRDCAMVFQNYALYPHMTVYENMAFGLRIAKVNKQEIDERVKEAARILDITDYLNKRPKEMSGGQRQRVALGRAIVRKPKVFLLDEPLSNLDAKLRAAMRTEITKLHQRLKTTFIYVTHDQVEAMTMGTRIVVMKSGLVQQIDTPKNLYDYPVNKFVAGFIGTPQMNFYEVKLIKNKDIVEADFNGISIKIPYSSINKIDISYLDGKKDVILGIRAEHINNIGDNVASKNNGSTPIKVIPNVIEELGSQVQINATIVGLDKDIVFTLKDSNGIEIGKEMDVYFTYEKLNFFDKETENTIMKRIPDVNKIKAVVNNHNMTIFNKEIALPKALKDLKNGEYDLEIPLKALVKGDTFKLKVLEKEQIGDIKLAYLDNNDQVVFALSDENKEFNFDIELEQVKFFKDGVLVKDSLKEFNTYISNLVRIKDVYNGKKVTGFKFNIEGHLIDVPAEYYEKTLAVLNKKFELHDIEFKFDKYQGQLGNLGIKLELLETYDYRSKMYGLFKMGNTTIIHLIKKPLKEYYLNLSFNDLSVRDTYFDIQLF